MATAPRLIHYEDDLLRKQNARWQLISLIACGGLCLALVLFWSWCISRACAPMS